MTYQQAPSYDARKEPYVLAEVVFRGILYFPIGKVKQNVSYNAENGKPHQRTSDASCTFAVTHGSRESGDLFPPLSLCSSVMVQIKREWVWQHRRQKLIFSPFPQPLKYSEFLVTGWMRYFVFIGPDCRLQ